MGWVERIDIACCGMSGENRYRICCGMSGALLLKNWREHNRWSNEIMEEKIKPDLNRG